LSPRDTAGHAAVTGAVAGLVGGLAFGAAMLQLDALPSMGLLLLAGTPVLAFAVHMLIAALVGSGFGLLARWFRSDPGETVSLGLAYGALWWYLGPLTLLPLLLATRPAWELTVAQQQFPGLLGHLLYGAVTGLALSVLRPRASKVSRPARGSLLRGMAAGVLGVIVVMLTVGTRLGLPPALAGLMPGPGRPAPLLAAVLLGPLIGLGYTLLYRRSSGGAGLALVRGQVYGFLLWVVGGLTVMPLLEGEPLTWTAVAVRADFVALPGFVVLGVAVALLHRVLGGLASLLPANQTPQEPARVGSGGLPAAAGLTAGAVGGLLFTIAAAGTGFIGAAARLVGSDSPAAGFAVHLLISIVLGVSYGKLFRHQSRTLGIALGWGLSYGFFWWVAGALTLQPMLLGGRPHWTAPAASASFAFLIGHLVYGTALGVTFYLLERRFGTLPPPPDPAHEAGPAALSDEHVLAAAPPLLAVMIVMIVTMPILLSGAA